MPKSSPRVLIGRQVVFFLIDEFRHGVERRRENQNADWEIKACNLTQPAAAGCSS
jgi:hypothetical protein